MNIKKIIALSSVVCCFFALLCGCSSEVTTDNYTFFSLDTDCQLKVYDDNAEKYSKVCEDAVNEVNSFFGNEGENTLYIKNGEDLSLSDEFIDVLRTGNTVYELTDGCFDLTVAPLTDLWHVEDATEPPEAQDILSNLDHVDGSKLVYDEEKNTFTATADLGIDIGGIAKGFAGDKAAKALMEAGCDAAVLSLGGNIRCWGTKKNGEMYNIAIKSPLNADAGDEYLGTVKCTDVSVVTSGTYERYFTYKGTRYHHIIDPKTGYPADTDILSATVVGSNGAAADAFATAIVVAGTEGCGDIVDAALRNEMCGVNGIIIVKNNCRVEVYGDVDFTLTSGDFVLERN